MTDLRPGAFVLLVCCLPTAPRPGWTVDLESGPSLDMTHRGPGLDMSKPGCAMQTWCRVPVPRPAGHTYELWGISGTTDRDVWLVGKDGDTGLVLHHDGERFDSPRIDSAALPKRHSAVYLTATNDVWIVGQEGQIYRGNPVLLTPLTNPAGPTSSLYGVHGSGPQDVWIVGKGGDGKGLVLRFDGMVLRPIFSEGIQAATIWHDVFVQSYGIATVGGDSSRLALYCHIDGENAVCDKDWYPWEMGANNLRGLWGWEDEVVGVGLTGALLLRTNQPGGVWSQVTRLTATLRDVHGANKESAWIVGDADTVLFWDHVQLMNARPDLSGGTTNWLDVWDGPDSTWIVSDSGLVYRRPKR